MLSSKFLLVILYIEMYLSDFLFLTTNFRPLFPGRMFSVLWSGLRGCTCGPRSAFVVGALLSSSTCHGSDPRQEGGGQMPSVMETFQLPRSWQWIWNFRISTNQLELKCRFLGSALLLFWFNRSEVELRNLHFNKHMTILYASSWEIEVCWW